VLDLLESCEIALKMKVWKIDLTFLIGLFIFTFFVVNNVHHKSLVKNESQSFYWCQRDEFGLFLHFCRFLEHGSIFCTTRSTLMNQYSSRSHAIFTIIVEQ